jgi:hypothetical protein
VSPPFFHVFVRLHYASTNRSTGAHQLDSSWAICRPQSRVSNLSSVAGSRSCPLTGASALHSFDRLGSRCEETKPGRTSAALCAQTAARPSSYLGACPHKDSHVQPPPQIDPAHCHSSRECSSLGSDCKIMQWSPESFLAQHSWSNTPAPPDVMGKSGTHRGGQVLPNNGSRRLASLHRRLSRGTWLPTSCCRGLSRFRRGFSQGWQFQLGLFCSAVVAMVQRLDARSFCFRPQLSVAVFLALVF